MALTVDAHCLSTINILPFFFFFFVSTNFYAYSLQREEKNIEKYAVSLTRRCNVFIDKYKVVFMPCLLSKFFIFSASVWRAVFNFSNIACQTGLWAMADGNSAKATFRPIFYRFHHYVNKSMQWAPPWNSLHTGVYIIFLIFAQSIDYGCLLEPPHWGGSNKHPKSLFES